MAFALPDRVGPIGRKPDVSVVVPVYNPGEHIQDLVDSLLKQSLPPTRFEVVFVDDGSTDETPALLDELSKEHRHFRVVHQPNSGWPGRPRNVGMDRARGKYVFFSDNDDWFGEEALERLFACAERNESDIVIGKMIGHSRTVPKELFRRNRNKATLLDAPLVDSMTPHKLFRREFLKQHDIRFPEGKRRLEDHVFVARAYLAATNISVLADYDCYHHITRPDMSNAGFRDIDPVEYYGYVREVVDVVVTNTEPGEVRDRFFKRFLGVEVLQRLEKSTTSKAEPEYLRRLYDAARDMVTECIPTHIDDEFPGRQRLAAQMLRVGDSEAMTRLLKWRLWSRAKMMETSWEDDALVVEWTARIGDTGLLRADGEKTMLSVPGAPTHAPVQIDVSADLGRAKADLIAVNARSGEVILPTKSEITPEPDGTFAVSGRTTITAGVGAKKLREGAWSLRLRTRLFGWPVDSQSLSWPGDGSVPVSEEEHGAALRLSTAANGYAQIEVDAQLPPSD